ncbi:MAG: MMPL family transporter [Nannocystaceae bacterium]
MTPQAPTPPDAHVSAWTRVVRDVVDRVTQTRARAGLTLIAGLVVALACLSFGRGVQINTDLRSLLPASAPSVRALDELTTRKGSTEMFIVAVESSDDIARAQMIERLAADIAAWPEASRVATGRDFTPLRDRALYFLDTGELDDLARELREAKQRAIARRIARDVGSEGDGAAPIEEVLAGDDWDDFGDDEEEDTPSAPTPSPDVAPEPAHDDPDVAAWVRDQKATLAARGELSAREIDLIWPEENTAGDIEWRDSVEDPFISADGDVAVVKAVLSKPATDITFAREVAERIRARAAEIQAEGIAPDARVQIVAAYNVSKDIDTILRDAKRATMLSVLLVTCVLVFGFRTVRALALVLVPMGIATCVTLACARLMLPQLNALTIFLFAVLFGMGVDFSVHLFALRPGHHAARWRDVIERHLRPLSASMVTTTSSLAVLGVADFKAFREFGAISAVGVFICFVCAVLFVPVVDTLWPTPPHSPRSSTAAPTRGRTMPWRWLALSAVAVFAVIGGPRLSFEKDLRQLNAQPKKGTGIAYGSATGRCSKSVVLVAETAEDLDAAVAALTVEQQEQRLLPDAPVLEGRPQQPWIRGVYSVAKILPEAQESKRDRLAQIGTLSNDFLAQLPDLDAKAQGYRTHLEALERLSKAAPIEPSALPNWARAPFVERDGVDDRLGHVCLRIRGGHLDELVAVKRRFDAILPPTVGRADSRLVFADLVAAMHVDARRLPLASLAVILLFIGLDLRRLRATLACFGALVLGLGFTTAWMGVVPIHLNFFNLVVMPAVLGLSIDTSIHLWHARTKVTVGQTSRATLISALTTMGGFAGLLVAEHPGLRSIGTLGVVSVLSCVSVAFLVLHPGRRGDAASSKNDA